MGMTAAESRARAASDRLYRGDANDIVGAQARLAQPTADTADDDNPFDASGMNSATALRNVAACVLEYTEVTRPHNGRGRPPTYAARVDAIAGAARQLAEMVVAWLDKQA